MKPNIAFFNFASQFMEADILELDVRLIAK
jgi:hypothetical protein